MRFNVETSIIQATKWKDLMENSFSEYSFSTPAKMAKGKKEWSLWIPEANLWNIKLHIMSFICILTGHIRYVKNTFPAFPDCSIDGTCRSRSSSRVLSCSSRGYRLVRNDSFRNVPAKGQATCCAHVRSSVNVVNCEFATIPFQFSDRVGCKPLYSNTSTETDARTGLYWL